MNSPLPVDFGEKKELYHTPYQRIYKQIAKFVGFEKEYFVTEFGERVSILLIERDKILLVKQYRFLINSSSWELPGGGVEPGETYIDAAKRECMEETGYECGAIESLFDYNITLDSADNMTRIYLCRDFQKKFDDKPIGDGEITESNWMNLAKSLDLIKSGHIKDPMTIIGLLYFNAFFRDAADFL